MNFVSWVEISYSFLIIKFAQQYFGKLYRLYGKKYPLLLPQNNSNGRKADLGSSECFL